MKMNYFMTIVTNEIKIIVNNADFSKLSFVMFMVPFTISLTNGKQN